MAAPGRPSTQRGSTWPDRGPTPPISPGSPATTGLSTAGVDGPTGTSAFNEHHEREGSPPCAASSEPLAPTATRGNCAPSQLLPLLTSATSPRNAASTPPGSPRC